MKKIKLIAFCLTLSLGINSCGNGNKKNSDEVIKTETKTEFPYKFIETKKEERQDNSYNEMLLYTCGEKPDVENLKLFCAQKKAEFTDGTFHFIVFFDNKENAKFPNNPVTALFMEDEDLKHIKAVYTLNNENGYSKLDFYEKNNFESSAKSIDIN